MAKKRNIFYHIRRKGQVLAYNLTSPEFVSQIYFRYLLGYRLNLLSPKTFNEKLQWLKLKYWPYEKRVIQCADKHRVRKYIEQIGRAEILNEEYFVWESPDDIVWEKLPEQFVLKCNHGCGYNILCPDKSALDERKTKKQLKKWMREDFSKFNAEPHYGRIPRRIICERYLGDNVINYNIYCLNGKPVFLSVAGGLGDGIGEHLTYYKTDGTIAPFKNRDYPTGEQRLSALLPQMLEVAEELAKGFPLVRVDLFDVKGRIVLSEMTFTPGGALIPFDSVEADRLLGDQLEIGNLVKNYG